ncbi:MAG: hypothetical protein RL216_3506 [Pseudomonadota bacterium]|jgi:CRP-like cAMP-binding protein
MTAIGQQFGVRHQVDSVPGEGDLRRLIQPQGRPLTVARHEVICRRGAVAEHVYIVQHGWAALRGPREAGRSPILRIYLPGEIIGLAEIGLTRVQQDVVMLTEGLVSVVPRSAVVAAAHAHARLWPVMVSMIGMELAAVQNRAILFDCAVAEDRLIHLLLDIRARLAVAGVGDGNRFPLLMSQAEIGEATGMTGIYVNRLLGRMLREKRIEMQRPYVRLLDRAGFEDRIAALDPAPVAEAVWPAKA